MEPNGPALVRLTIERIRAAFPDITFDVRGVYVDGDTAISQLKTTGTHDGPWMLGHDDPYVVEPTGTEIELRGMRLFQFEDGVVTESHAYADEFDLALEPGFACDFAEYITSRRDQE